MNRYSRMKTTFAKRELYIGLCLFSSLSIHGALVQEGFAPAVNFPANSSPLNVSLADIDGDGLVDVAVANFTPGVSVLRNTSSPMNVQLSPPVFYSTAIGAIDVKFGDLDGDGKLDMVAAVGGGVSVFRNISSPGTIAFAPRINFVFGSASLPNGVVIQDFNGDGKPDLAFLHHDNSAVRVLKNVSSPGILNDSSFVLAAQFSTSLPIDIASGDFNGDSLPDFFVAASSGSFFTNSSSGSNLSFVRTFSQPSLRFIQDAGVDDVLVGELDGDGRIDLVGRTSTVVSLIRNTTTNSAITLSTQPVAGAWTATGVGYLNFDNKLDLITANRFGKQIAIHTNNATAGVLNSNSFILQTTIQTSNNPFSIAIGDIDGDGRDDIVTSSSDGANVVTVYRNLLNHSPIAEAGLDQILECSGNLAQLTLDGSASVDIDGDSLTYAWFFGTNQIGTGSVLSMNLNPGSYLFRLRVSDSLGASEEDTVQIVVQDSISPEFLALTASPSLLWPPNNKMASVIIHADILDTCDGTPLARILSVTSNEAEKRGKLDWEITGPFTLNLRAERLGSGAGRTYTVTVEATDSAGNSATNQVSIFVPLSLGKNASP
jgi:hypothetical protein